MREEHKGCQEAAPLNFTEKTMTYSAENTLRDGFQNFRIGVSAPQPVENARQPCRSIAWRPVKPAYLASIPPCGRCRTSYTACMTLPVRAPLLVLVLVAGLETPGSVAAQNNFEIQVY